MEGVEGAHEHENDAVNEQEGEDDKAKETNGEEDESEEEHTGILVGESLPPRVVGERSGMACLTLALVLPDAPVAGTGSSDAERVESSRYCLVSVQWWGEQTSVSFRCGKFISNPVGPLACSLPHGECVIYGPRKSTVTTFF